MTLKGFTRFRVRGFRGLRLQVLGFKGLGLKALGLKGKEFGVYKV